MTSDALMQKEYRALLNECQGQLLALRELSEKALKMGRQEEDPPAVMLSRTFDFGLHTINVVAQLEDEEAANGLAACAVTRAFFEAAVRLLWAARTLPGAQNPWIRLQVYWATEDLKWANAAGDFEDTQEHAAEMRRTRQEVRDRRDQNGVLIQPAPAIIDMLRDIDKANCAEGLTGEKDVRKDYIYTNVYRILCAAAHGHPVALRRDNRHHWLRHAQLGLLLSASYLLEAVCHVGSADPKSAIEALAKKVLKLAEDAHDPESQETH